MIVLASNSAHEPELAIQHEGKNRQRGGKERRGDRSESSELRGVLGI
jgi:hypothetical protein